MPPINALQPTFSGGEFSPSLYSRVDIAKYSTGLKTARNFFIHPHGGASNRQGTEYIAAAKYAAKKSRLIPFEFSTEQAYVLEFGEHYIRVFKDGTSVSLAPTYPNAEQYAPTSSFSTGDVVKIGPYYPNHWVHPGGGVLELMLSYGDDVPTSYSPSNLWLNTSDTLSVTSEVVNGNLNTIIKLANATPSKNAAPLIQAALRAANPVWANAYVIANPTWAASPPITMGSSGALPNVQEQRMVMCTQPITGSSGGVIVSPYVGTGYVTPYNINTAYFSESLPTEIVTPYLEADLPDLKLAQSADVLYITHPSHSPRMLVRYAVDDWAIETYAFENGPFMPSNTSATTMSVSVATGAGTMTASTATFSQDHIGSLWEVNHPIESQAVSGTLVGVTASNGIRCGNTWRLTTRGTWTGTIKVEKADAIGGPWRVVRTFTSVNDFNPSTFGEVSEPCFVRLNCTVLTSGTPTFDLTADAYTHTGVVEITGVTSATVATILVKKRVGDTGATDDWSEGSWSEYRGWPAAVIFYQDRLCFAGTVSEPQTIWMSQTGIYDDFGRSSPLLDTDGITVNLPSRKMNGIKNLLSFGDILALTASTEWSVGAGSSGVITPTSVTTKLEGYRGSATVDPVIVGNRALYFQPMGAILRDMGYSFEANGYNGDDLTIIANHLFDSHSITEMAYQQEPDSLLWCVREDGKLLSLTYLREQEVVAWTWHETQGTVESVCSIPGDGYNEVWLVVNRTIGGQATRLIERFVPRMASTAPADQIFMDCSKTVTLSPANTTVTGLNHLEGKEVAVLADGNVVTGKTVSGGSITLANAASKVHVGLGYTCDLETLNVELNMNTGTTQGTQVKISEVTLRFLNSRGGQVGPDEGNLDDIITRTSEPLGSATNLYTGDIKMSIVSGYDVGGRIFFRQSKPLPTTILAVIPVVTVGG